MPTEIRPVTRAEAVDYLRVLPQATGLPMWEPAPAAWHSGHGPWPPRPAPPSEDTLAAYADTVVGDGFHSQAAVVDGRIVGGSATLSLELTVPGLRQVPLGGVTATGVLPTHRRRGLLRGMMTAMLRDCRERGEFLSGLSASEGGIYGRYGFSPATFQVRWELDRTEAAFSGRPAAGDNLELVRADVVKAAWPALHDRVRRRRVGEVSARPGKWDGLSEGADGTDGPLRFLVHRGEDGDIDGIAHFRTPWSADPALVGTLQVEVLEAATPAAYATMWRLLTDFDLTRRVVAARRPVDEPLRWMLANPRAIRVTRSADNLWLRILDVRAALEARSYDAAGSLVIAVDDPMFPSNEGRWRLDASPDGASCRAEPGGDVDLAMDVRALGSLYLGGVSPTLLAGAGRITELHPGALAVLGRLLRQDSPPFNAVGF
jgi:predicted acetyltransferase